MPRRTQQQWLALFDQQKTSGLNYTDFANSKGISPKYFSLRRSQLKSNAISTDKPKGRFIATSIKPVAATITLKHKDIKITLPITVSAAWLAQFVLQLGQ